MTHTLNPTLIDIRSLDHRQRRTQIFAAFDHLGVGESLELLSSEEPQTVRSQFELEKPKLFSWSVLESGPAVWRVNVTKLKGQHGVDHCCGACAG